MIYSNYCWGKFFQECFQSLKHCFGDQSPSKATVSKWFRQLMSGARTLEEDDRCGRMTTTVTPENISRVESLIKKDLKMTYAEIKEIIKISLGSFTCILHDCLGVRKGCILWMPHKLSEEKKRGRVDWCIHALRKFDGGKSPRCFGHRSRRRDLGISIRPRDEATVGGVGLPRREPTCEIQKKQKCFQTNDSLFLCKNRPRCHHTA